MTKRSFVLLCHLCFVICHSLRCFGADGRLRAEAIAISAVVLLAETAKALADEGQGGFQRFADLAGLQRSFARAELATAFRSVLGRDERTRRDAELIGQE